MSEPQMLDGALLKRFPLPTHADDSTKDDRGQFLVVGGSREVPGGAMLAGFAGMRAGAGKLQIATAASVAVAVAVAMPEGRIVGYAEDDEGCIAADAIDKVVELVANADAAVVGCGMQHGEALDRFLDALLAAPKLPPLVLDAAVLGSLPGRVDAIRALGGKATALPHVGEMARMLDCEEAEIEADPLAAARRAVDRFGITVVIKGQDSFIVSPDGQAFRFRGGGVGLATSGSGDVLAGIVGGLCARGAGPLTATLWGVHLHGEAGRRLSVSVGRVGFLARELVDLVPRIMGGGA